MFIRRKKNQSGSISIQIIDKSDGRYRVLRTVGSSSDPDEIETLLSKARTQVLELTQQLQFKFLSKEDRTVLSFFNNSDDISIWVTGPEKVAGLLFDRIGFNVIEEELFRHLIIARLVYPGSKLRTTDYLLRYQGIHVDVSSIYRFLDRLNEDHKATVEQIAFNYTRKTLGGELHVVFYDITTLYFEASSEDDLRKTGFSKDGKAQHPQILLGFLVALGGYPLGYEIFEGNTFEGHTLIPFLESFENKYSTTRPIVVADAGLLSKKNVEMLEELGYQYILGARIKTESVAVKNRILSLNVSDGKSRIIKKSSKEKLIISYSSKRARKDQHNRERGLKRLQKNLRSGKLTKGHINNRGYNKYLKMEGEVSIQIDYDKFKADDRWDGLKGYLTNSKLPKGDVIANYQSLWQIEKAFRISKTDLRVRPIFHRLRKRIEAHICICFVAYSIYKELERILYQAEAPFSTRRALDLTQTMYSIEFKLPDSKGEISKDIGLNQDQQLLLQILADS